MNLKFWHFNILILTLTTLVLSMKTTLEIIGFDNDKGNAFVEIVNERGEVITQLVLPITKQKVVKVVELPSSGSYGVKVFHDENNNKKLDKNLVGYPVEKWGVSNGARPAFRAPKTEEILVDVRNNSTIKIIVE